jgi:AraC-like DNA-binding protein/quercetin dioxygenase-like cupin family protein
VESGATSTRWSSFEEVQPIPPSSQGIVWRHFGNHYDHPRHRHVALELNFVIGGRGHYEVAGRCYPLSAGTVLFIPPAADHYLEERTPDFDMWILALKPALLERTCAGAEGAAFLQTVAAGDCARLLSVDDARWLGGEIRRFAETRSTPFLHAGLAYAMAGAQEAFARGRGATREAAISDEVRRCMAFLDEDPALSRDDLADRAGADPDALSHAFTRELGVGLVVYRNRLRLRRFFDLASTGRLTLLDACLEAGFGSYPQFHRVFVAETGRTPRDYLGDRFRSPARTAPPRVRGAGR